MRVLSSERKQGPAHAHSMSAAPCANIVYVQESMRMHCDTLQTHGLFLLLLFLDLEYGRTLPVYEGSESSQIESKICICPMGLE